MVRQQTYNVGRIVKFLVSGVIDTCVKNAGVVSLLDFFFAMLVNLLMMGVHPFT